MKKLLLLLIVAGAIAFGQTTYTWNVASGAWTTAASWSPARTVPATNDILIFDGAVQLTSTVTGVPKETIGQLKFTNNVTVTISSGTAGGTGTFTRSTTAVTGTGTSFLTEVTVGDLIYGLTTLATYDVTAISSNTALTTSQSGTLASQSFAVCPRLTINGDTGTDFDIQSGSTLLVGISAAPGIVFSLVTGTTASIAGTIKFHNSGTTAVGGRIIAADASTITVTSTGVVEQGTATGTNVFNGTMFGISGTANIAVFQNGSTFIQRSGSHPGGLTQPSSKVVFNSASNYKFYLSGSPALTGRTFGNFIVGNTANCNPTVNLSADCIMYDITQEAGAAIAWSTTGTPAAGTLRIRGNISQSGTFAFSLANNGSGGIVFDGGTTQTISGAGTSTTTFVHATSISSGTTLNTTRNLVMSVGFTDNGTFDAGTSVISGVGSFTVASAATFKSGHTSGINGNITVSGAKTLSTSANYEYNGSSAQVTGALLPATLNNLTINNGTGLTLSGSTSVGGTLTLTSGNIALGGNTLTLGSSTSTTGTLVATSGNITGTGTFTRWFGSGAISLGDVAGRFPMGVGTNNRSVWIGGTPSVGGTVSVAYTDAATTSAISFTEISNYVNRYDASWVVSTANSFAGTGLSLQIQGSGIPGITNITDITISGAAGVAGGSALSTSGTTTDPVISRNGLTEATLGSTFYIASTSTSALPVELVSFSGASKGRKVELHWNTATETNNSGFEVEKNVNGNWSKIGFVNGAGNSNSPKVYGYVDAISANGTYSYRLKQIDNDGKFQYSAMVEVKAIDVVPIEFTLAQNFPNPFNPTTTIRFTVKGTEHATVKIYDITGREVATLFNDVATPGQMYNVQFNATSLSSGIYFYVLNTKSFREVKKMQLLK